MKQLWRYPRRDRVCSFGLVQPYHLDTVNTYLDKSASSCPCQFPGRVRVKDAQGDLLQLHHQDQHHAEEGLARVDLLDAHFAMPDEVE